ncbi:14744_t:CDS:2, partial [Acaulospora colombiana]
QDDIMVYSDGSGFDGQIGAAAVMYRNGRLTKHLQYHLGPITEHTVYEGELIGILLALELLKTIRARRPKVHINLDNQAAIISTLTNRPQPAHHILDEIITTIDDIQRSEATRHTTRSLDKRTPIAMTINWVPGHLGIPGNVEADTRAKNAAQGHSSDPQELPRKLRVPLPISVSALRQELRTEVKRRWKNQWARSQRFTRLNNIDKSLPSSRFRKLIQGPLASRYGSRPAEDYDVTKLFAILPNEVTTFTSPLFSGQVPPTLASYTCHTQ